MKNNPQFAPANAADGFRRLMVELSSVRSRPNIYLLVRSGKFARVIDIGSSKSVQVWRHARFTLRYAARISTDQEGDVEVVRDENGALHFRENGLLFTPGEFAVKLVDLIAA